MEVEQEVGDTESKNWVVVIFLLPVWPSGNVFEAQ